MTAGRNGGDWALCRRQEGANQYDREFLQEKLKNVESTESCREERRRAGDGGAGTRGRRCVPWRGQRELLEEVARRRGSQGNGLMERLVEEVEAKALAVRFDFEESLEEQMPGMLWAVAVVFGQKCVDGMIAYELGMSRS